MKTQEWNRGDKVECNGNREAVVQSNYSETMYVVRLFSGSRIIGDVCVSGSELKATK